MNNMYVFQDGRIIYNNSFLTSLDSNYIEIDKLPEILQIEGKIGCLKADIKNNKVIVEYIDYIEPLEINEPIQHEKTNKPVTNEELREIQNLQLAIQLETAEEQKNSNNLALSVILEMAEMINGGDK